MGGVGGWGEDEPPLLHLRLLLFHPRETPDSQLIVGSEGSDLALGETMFSCSSSPRQTVVPRSQSPPCVLAASTARPTALAATMGCSLHGRARSAMLQGEREREISLHQLCQHHPHIPCSRSFDGHLASGTNQQTEGERRRKRKRTVTRKQQLMWGTARAWLPRRQPRQGRGCSRRRRRRCPAGTGWWLLVPPPPQQAARRWRRRRRWGQWRGLRRLCDQPTVVSQGCGLQSGDSKPKHVEGPPPQQGQQQEEEEREEPQRQEVFSC